MLKFNDNNIAIGLIKTLLRDFNLPMCQVWKNGMYVVKDCLYLKDNEIFKALHTGIYRTNELHNRNLFKLIYNNYSFGDRIPNITKNLKIRNVVYDSYTHKYLGDYLRFIRDYTGLDLMPLYNCFSNEVLNSSVISFSKLSNDSQSSTSEKYKFFDWHDTSYKVYVVPVCPFQEYTIALECTNNVELLTCYYTNGQLLYKDSDGFSMGLTYEMHTNTQYSKPILYTKLADAASEQLKSDAKFIINKDSMALLIKLPADCNTTITVLEGDYTKTTQKGFDKLGNSVLIGTQIFPAIMPHNDVTEESDGNGNTYKTNIDALGDTLADKPRPSVVSALSLLQLNTGVSYPFADRLLEYLYDNVIIPNDRIGENIMRVQDIMLRRAPSEGMLNYVKYAGMFDTQLRNSIIDAIQSEGLDKSAYDLLGYVDKDVEKLITISDEVK